MPFEAISSTYFFMNYQCILSYVSDVFIMQTPFGYTRKDVLLIGLGVTVAGYGLKGGLEVL